MKSVDRDFVANGVVRYLWGVSYAFVAFGAFAAYGRFWDEIHPHGMQFYSLTRIVVLPLIYVCPFILSLAFRSYIRCALKENLVSERVFKNCEYWIGLQLMLVYMAIMEYSTWN